MIQLIQTDDNKPFRLYWFPKGYYPYPYHNSVRKPWLKIPKFLNVPFIAHHQVSKPLFKIIVNYAKLQPAVQIFGLNKIKKLVTIKKLYTNKHLILNIIRPVYTKFNHTSFIEYSGWVYSKYIDWFFVDSFAVIKLFVSTYIINAGLKNGILINWKIFWFLVKNNLVKSLFTVFNSYYIILKFTYKFLFNSKTVSISTWFDLMLNKLAGKYISVFKKRNKEVYLNKLQLLRFFFGSLTRFVGKRSYILRHKLIINHILIKIYKSLIFYFKKNNLHVQYKNSYLFFISLAGYINWIRFILSDEKTEKTDFFCLLTNFFVVHNELYNNKQSQTYRSNRFITFYKPGCQYEFRLDIKNPNFSLNYLFISKKFIYNKNIRNTLTPLHMLTLHKGLYIQNLNIFFNNSNSFQYAFISFIYKNNMLFFKKKKISNSKIHMFKYISKLSKYQNIDLTDGCSFYNKVKIVFNFFNPYSHYCWYIDVDKYIPHSNNRYNFFLPNSLI